MNLGIHAPILSVVFLGCLTESEPMTTRRGSQRPIVDGPATVSNQGGVPEAEPAQPTENAQQPEQPVATGNTEEPPMMEVADNQNPPPHGNVQNTGSGCSFSSLSKEGLGNKRDQITIRSSVAPENQEHNILIEIVRDDPQRGSVVLHNISCFPSDTQQYQLPRNIGPVYAVYFRDSNRNGPSLDDLRGRSPLIDTEKESRFSFTLQLEENADVSPLRLPFLPQTAMLSDAPPSTPPPEPPPPAVPPPGRDATPPPCGGGGDGPPP
ncbi:MAG: hypothetical protein VX278_19880, partial [Myxococcota bacterium]|nr:hypothetical protein [Myxococcota bacterium]